MIPHNSVNAYDADFHVAEIYDQCETHLDDVAFLRQLIGDFNSLNILEPFSGTGRILIPLALDGHQVQGMDQSAGMLNRAFQKIQALPPEAQQRIGLTQADVLLHEWPRGFDLVILGCNCFYELATWHEQERCINQAFHSLQPGGHIFIDSDHMEGGLASSWQDIGEVKPSLAGKCSDGTTVECTRETLWFSVPDRLAQFRRQTKVTHPDGSTTQQEYIQQKHPVSRMELQGWLEQNGFIIEAILGDYHGTPYSISSPRAIFWARRN